jgi:hypothetical protein
MTMMNEGRKEGKKGKKEGRGRKLKEAIYLSVYLFIYLLFATRTPSLCPSARGSFPLRSSSSFSFPERFLVLTVLENVQSKLYFWR